MNITHSRVVKRGDITLLLMMLAFLVAVSFFSSARRESVASVEVKFTDASAHGLAIVPASCPSNPHTVGECGSSCTPSVLCQSATYVRTVASNCSVTVTACPANWSCSGGGCIPPPDPSVISFNATDANGVAFSATGHLQVRPALLRGGNTAQVYWNAAYVSSCTVTSNGGGNWDVPVSGPSGKTSLPITERTTFTLDCIPRTGSTAPHLHESAVVNIAPIYQEQ